MKNALRFLILALAGALCACLLSISAAAQRIPDDIRSRVVKTFQEEILPGLPRNHAELKNFVAQTTHTVQPAAVQSPRELQNRISNLGPNKITLPIRSTATTPKQPQSQNSPQTPQLGAGPALSRLPSPAQSITAISQSSDPVRPNFGLAVTPIADHGDTVRAFVYSLSQNSSILLGLIFKQDGNGGLTFSPEFVVDTFNTAPNGTFIGQTFKIWEGRIDADYADGVHGLILFEFDRNGNFLNSYFSEFSVGFSAQRNIQISTVFVINIPVINQTFLFIQGVLPSSPVSIALCIDQGFCAVSPTDVTASNGAIFTPTPLSFANGTGSTFMPATVIIENSSTGECGTAPGKIQLN